VLVDEVVMAFFDGARAGARPSSNGDNPHKERLIEVFPDEVAMLA
jgi:hypothetical protein